jgi:hypothetical protein
MVAAVSDAGLAVGAGPDSAAGPPAATGQLWCMGPGGELRTIRVRTGISDGQKTVVEGPGLVEGTRVIVGTTRLAESGRGTTANPFQTRNQARPGPPPPGF